MRNLKTIAIALVTLVSFTVNAQQTKKINAAKSGIVWTGKKVTGSHTQELSVYKVVLWYLMEKY